MYQCLKVENRQHRDQAKPKALRKEGWIPGVIFGKEIKSVSMQVKETDLKKFLQGSGSVFEIEVGGTKHLCNLDHLQKDALGQKYVHVSFHKLKANQKTTVNVPIHYVGDAPGVKAGGVLNLMYDSLDVKGLPKDIPEFIEVDLSTIEMNESFHLSSVTCPPGCEWTIDEETNLVSCHAPKVVEETTEATEPELVGEEGAEAPAAEGEAPAEEEKKAA